MRACQRYLRTRLTLGQNMSCSRHSLVPPARRRALFCVAPRGHPARRLQVPSPHFLLPVARAPVCGHPCPAVRQPLPLVVARVRRAPPARTSSVLPQRDVQAGQLQLTWRSSPTLSLLAFRGITCHRSSDHGRCHRHAVARRQQHRCCPLPQCHRGNRRLWRGWWQQAAARRCAADPRRRQGAQVVERSVRATGLSISPSR